MARTNATNFSGGLQFPYATAATDIFKKEDVQTLAQAVDQHDHTAGKGVAVNTTPAAGSITNAQLGHDVARANLLTNGGFEIWQRGAGPFTTGTPYCADRWGLSIAGSDTLSVSRDTTNMDSANGSLTCAACTITVGTGGGPALIQLLKTADGYQQANLAFSLSVRVRTSTANAVRVGIYNGTAWTYSSYHSGGGAYETLTVTATETASPNLQVGVFFMLSCTAYVDSACLVVGAQPSNYVPLHPADDLHRCQRYYELIGAVAGGAPAILGYAGVAGEIWGTTLFYKANKPVTPTLTKLSNFSATNCSQPVVDQPANDSCRMSTTATAIGAFGCNAGVAGIAVEANP